MTKTDTLLLIDMLRQSLAQGQIPFLTISSNSMTPLLKTGDQVGLAPVTIDQLSRGDIVTLLQDDHLLTHRFWGVAQGQRPFTRGDRPLTPDKPGSAGQILGRVIVRRRHQRELALQNGIGRRLNQHLARLIRLEAALLTGHAPGPTAPTMPLQKQRTLWVRLVRRAFFVWASLVEKIVTRLAVTYHQQESP